MNHLKNVWEWLKDHYTMPTPLEMINHELVDAQRSKLRHESAQEYHAAIVKYNNDRILRLNNYLNTNLNTNETFNS